VLFYLWKEKITRWRDNISRFSITTIIEHARTRSIQTASYLFILVYLITYSSRGGEGGREGESGERVTHVSSGVFDTCRRSRVSSGASIYNSEKRARNMLSRARVI